MEELKTNKKRIHSIDFLRGCIIMLMTLDHTRDYFQQLPFAPLDLDQTTPLIFMTRWITHLCAPIFIFLSGISIYFSTKRKTSKKSQSLFLLTRGLWLIIIELFLINFAWRFNIHFNWITLGVLWVIGVCMILMAAFIWFSKEVLLAIALLLLIGHNLFDYLEVFPNLMYKANEWDLVNIIYSILHYRSIYEFSSTFHLSVLYPVIPWISVMILGFLLGGFFHQDISSRKRRKAFLLFAFIGIGLFTFLRITSIYGDHNLVEPDKYTGIYYLFDILDCTKYPPSLCYLLITLSIGFIVLALSEGIKGKVSYPIIVFGRVPFFFYMIHIYIIHGIALVLSTLLFDNTVEKNFLGISKSFTFETGYIYLITLGILLLIWPLCYAFNKYKTKNVHLKWLSYF